jgi:hypothetical protein
MLLQLRTFSPATNWKACENQRGRTLQPVPLGVLASGGDSCQRVASFSLDKSWWKTNCQVAGRKAGIGACKPPYKPPRRRYKPLRKRSANPSANGTQTLQTPCTTNPPIPPQAILRRTPSALRPQTGCAMLRLVRSHRPTIPYTASRPDRTRNGKRYQRTADISSLGPHACLRGECARDRRAAGCLIDSAAAACARYRQNRLTTASQTVAQNA